MGRCVDLVDHLDRVRAEAHLALGCPAVGGVGEIAAKAAEGDLVAAHRRSAAVADRTQVGEVLVGQLWRPLPGERHRRWSLNACTCLTRLSIVAGARFRASIWLLHPSSIASKTCGSGCRAAHPRPAPDQQQPVAKHRHDPSKPAPHGSHRVRDYRIRCESSGNLQVLVPRTNDPYTGLPDPIVWPPTAAVLTCTDTSFGAEQLPCRNPVSCDSPWFWHPVLKVCDAQTPLVLKSVHAFIWPFSRAARRPCSGSALYAPQTPVNHIDGARSSGFRSLSDPSGGGSRQTGERPRR